MNIRNKVKHLLAGNPYLFYPVFKIFGGQHFIKECMLNEESEIVIEGFPRSANTFSVVAFRFAQKRKINIAHHLHVESQVIEGVKKGLPVVVLIRNPDEAMKSLMVREPKMKAEYGFKRYCEFYSSVKKLRSKVVIAEFKEITNNYSKIIENVNAKFNVEYIPYESNRYNDESVYKMIDEINGKFDDGKETHVARPSIKRKDVFVDLGDSIYRRKAMELYMELVE
jgi:hypothetical protein